MSSIEEALALAGRLLAAGRPGDAVRVHRQILAQVPDHPQTVRSLAALAAAAGRKAQATRLLERALALAPGYLRAALELAPLLAEREEAGRAARAVQRAVVLDPASAEAQIVAGYLSHRDMRAEEAARAFGRAVRLAPDEVAGHLNRGSALFDAGRWREAEQALRRAAALQPAHGYALFQLARSRRRLGAGAGTGAGAAAPLSAALRLEAPRADFETEAAALSRGLGDWHGVRRHGWRALVLAPGDVEALLACGLAAERDDPDVALAFHERAIRSHPGFGEPFTRRALLLLNRRWGPPPPPRPTAGRAGRRLACTALGGNGRFGNQILQYGFLRLYAAEHDLDLEVPDWIGRHLYDLDDPLPGPPLPTVTEEEADFAASLNRETPAVYADRNLTGFFCYHTARLARFRDGFRGLFRPGRTLRPFADAVESSLRSHGRTVVALHLRRGDFGWGRFWIAPAGWYLSWLEALWPRLDRPVLYIATDAPELAGLFAAYRPLTAADIAAAIGRPPDGAEFLTDFQALCCADVTAISNSTFSFTATMLNTAPARTGSDDTASHGRFWRPDRAAAGLVPYDPWAAEVLL